MRSIGTHFDKDRKRPFSHYLLLSMILLILVVASGITVIDYLNARANYERNAASLEIQTEQNIARSIEIIDAGFQLFDDSQNEQMQDGFVLFMAEYERSGRTPGLMDLAGLKEKLGKNTDLYIINESGVIEYTTYAPDLNLDFRKVPYFHDYLTKVRLSEGYFSDRVVREINTGQLRKFAYMPTPDHKYVLEIGLTGPLYSNQRSFEAYHQNIDKIGYLNPYVKDVTIFDLMKKPMDRSSPVPDAATNALLDQIITERTGRAVIDEERGLKTTYLFVDLYDPQYGSDVSRIVRITYDTTLITKQLDELLLAHFISAMVAILLGIVVAILVSRFLAAPVYQIVSDVDTIAKGDLAHSISPPTIGREFVILEESVNTMVSTLTGALMREKESEARYRHLVENIPIVVWTARQDGKTVFISRNVERVYGYTPEELCENGEALFFDRIHPDDRSMVRAEFAGLFIKKTIDIEYRIRHRDGAWIWLHYRSTSVYQQDGQWYADGIFSDITERRHTQEHLQRLSEELDERVRARTAELQRTEEGFRQANRKLNLLSSITRHDILNQLTIMIGYLKLAEERVPDPDVKKYLATAQHAGEVIDRHMLFTRLYQNVGVHAPTWQNISKLMQRVRMDIPAEHILLQVETGDLELHADPLLEKVFFTLFENTLRHGGEASVVRLTFTRGDTDLTLVYEDNGPGIGPQEKERIFEWGYGRHTGFGLYLSREILAITGLTIRETGEAGKGARFEIRIPPSAYRFLSSTPGLEQEKTGPGP